jgi:hypothetical protein
MSCGPNQADYIEVTNSSKSTIKPDQKMVLELTYYVTNKFANDVFNSCKDVQFSSASAKVMQLLCGDTNCNPEKFLKYIGRKDPSPMQIDVVITNDTIVDQNGKNFIPMNAEAVSCTKAPPGYSNNSCNCVDCPIKCSPKPFPKPEEPWLIWGVDGMWIIMGFIYYGLVVVVTFGFIFYYYKTNNGSLQL